MRDPTAVPTRGVCQRRLRTAETPRIGRNCGDQRRRRPRSHRSRSDARACRLDAVVLHDRLRREGPSSVAELAESLDAEAADLETSLRVLETAGLVVRAGDRWSVVGKGVFFEIPD